MFNIYCFCATAYSHGPASVCVLRKAASLFLIMLTLHVGVEIGHAEEETATLTIKREDANGGSAWSWTVYVNSEKIGTIKNDTTRSFYFTPSEDGKNTIQIEGYNIIGDNPKSKVLGMNVFRGGSVSCCVGYSPESPLNLRLTVDVKDKGAEPRRVQVAAAAVPSNSKVLSVKLDKKMKAIVIKETPAMRPARGTERTIEDTVRVKHSVIIASHWKVEKEVKSHITAGWLSLEGGIRSSIEKSANKTYGVETERKRSVILKGDDTVGAVKIVWVDYFRTGTAIVSLDGKEFEIPFEFREDFDLLTEDAD